MIELDHPSARHPMWWTAENYHLYRVSLRVPPGAAVPAGTKLPLQILPGVSDPGF